MMVKRQDWERKNGGWVYWFMQLNDRYENKCKCFMEVLFDRQSYQSIDLEEHNP
jgi:hypothetical protein